MEGCHAQNVDEKRDDIRSVRMESRHERARIIGCNVDAIDEQPHNAGLV